MSRADVIAEAYRRFHAGAISLRELLEVVLTWRK